MIRILKEAETNRGEIFAREDPVDSVEEPVRAILAQVKARGDEALKEYTKAFDGVELTSLEVGPGAVDEGFRSADPLLVEILYRAAERIAAFHQHQVRNSFLVNEEDGILMGQKVLPLARVGLYVPGGTAAYPSSVLMNCIPAKIAGNEVLPNKVFLLDNIPVAEDDGRRPENRVQQAVQVRGNMPAGTAAADHHDMDGARYGKPHLCRLLQTAFMDGL